MLLLGENSIQGSIPPELGRLSQLVALDLGSTQLTGALPAELGDSSPRNPRDLDRIEDRRNRRYHIAQGVILLLDTR